MRVSLASWLAQDDRVDSLSPRLCKHYGALHPVAYAPSRGFFHFLSSSEEGYQTILRASSTAMKHRISASAKLHSDAYSRKYTQSHNLTAARPERIPRVRHLLLPLSG